MKTIKGFAAAAMVLLLWGCVLTPGRFDASLDLRRDGSFAYRYEGEIQLLTMHSTLAMLAEGQPWDPKAQRCSDDPPGDKEGDELSDEDLMGGEERDCTAAELEERRAEWEKNRADERAKMETMRAFFGGLDPSDPATVAEFTRRLLTYDGWKRISHKGNGVFDVLYEVKGSADRDFVFPVFPEIDVVIPFVRMSRRTDGALKIAAPAFAQNEEMMGGQAMGAAMAAGAASGGGGLPAAFKRPEGRFTITTDGEILTNNTENGPAAGTGGAKQLRWTVGALDKTKPEALIRL
jgi:hypothetical protein